MAIPAWESYHARQPTVNFIHHCCEGAVHTVVIATSNNPMSYLHGKKTYNIIMHANNN